MKVVFGVDLFRTGILPIHLSVKNEGAERLQIRRDSIRLKSTQGRDVAPIQETELADLLTTVQPRLYTVPGPGAASVPFLFSLLANLEAGTLEATEAELQRAELETRRLSIFNIDETEVRDGFIYYDIRKHRVSTEKMELIVPIYDISDKKQYIVHLPLQIKRR